MGCGVSSGSQISPIDNINSNQIEAELPQSSTPPPPPTSMIDMNKNGTPNSLICSKSNSAKSRIGLHNDISSGKFNLGFLFPCRFYGTGSTSMTNVTLAIKDQSISVHVQTDNDILGFKCQYSQTDSLILSDGELDAMCTELEKEMKNIQEECKDIHNGNSMDIEDELFELQFMKTWRDIIHNHRNEFEPEKRFANVAVQATRPQTDNSTQTKFGSIDHQFVPNPLFSKTTPSHIVQQQNELLTKTISENLLKAIEHPLDQHLTDILSKFDVEDVEDLNGLNETDPEKIVESIENTLSNYEDTQINEVEENIGCDIVNDKAQLLPNSVPHEENDSNQMLPNVTKRKPTIDVKRKMKEAQKRIKLLKQQKFHDCLEMIIDDIRNSKKIEELLPPTGTTNIVKKRDVSLQTTNDILTDEATHFTARPPLCNKNEMIPSILMFREIDRKIKEASNLTSTQEIGQFVLRNTKNDLFKIRAIYMWVIENIRYNGELVNHNMVSSEIIERREGVSKDYCQLFGDLCRHTGIRVKRIDGFVRLHDFRPGYYFKLGEDLISSWNAVFVLSSWRFIDLTLAAGYVDGSGEFHQEHNEHYFLTDPNVMIWTHFPYNELEDDYERWQLLDKPLTLEQFNSQPKVTENFFNYNLSIRSKVDSPLQFRISTEIKIGSHEAFRYKYKLYRHNEIENASLNHYVFCQLKEDRLVGSFMVSPPFEGRLILKIFAKPEREMHGSQQDLSAILNPVITMLLDCTKARKYIEPLPISELPWGPTQKFYDYKLRLMNQKGPTVVTWGGRRRLVLEANETMLLTYSLFDSESMEMDARSVISREDVGLKTTFTINPPRVGTFKLMLFGMPKPKQKGKWRLPLLATFMIDCKLIKPPQHDEDMVIQAPQVSSTEDVKKQKQNKK